MININRHKQRDVYLQAKRGKSKRMKRNKGITLIALVITIIILIILAAIAINAVFGENGLILRAQEAKFKTEVGVIKDLVEIEKINISSSGEITFHEGVLNNLNIPTDQKTKYIGTERIIYINGKLYYWNGEGAEFDTTQKQWLEDIGIGPYIGGGLGTIFDFAVVRLNYENLAWPEFLEGFEEGVFVAINPISGEEELISILGAGGVIAECPTEEDVMWWWNMPWFLAIGEDMAEIYITDPSDNVYVLDKLVSDLGYPSIKEDSIETGYNDPYVYILLHEPGEWTFRLIVPTLEIDRTMSFIIE